MFWREVSSRRSGGSGWDSFCLNTTNTLLNLPGGIYSGDAPGAFASREETVRYLEEYAEGFEVPVRTRTAVQAVTRSGDRYLVETERRSIEARAVVVAGGYFALPRIPASAANLAPDIFQVH